MPDDRCERSKLPLRSRSSYTLDAARSDESSPTRVLFATAGPTADGECLDRARAFAEVLHSQLEVWCMGQTPSQDEARLQLASSGADRSATGVERTDDSCLPGAASAVSVPDGQLRDGFVQRVAAHARELSAILLVLSGSEQPASRAIALTRATGRPVLVARPRLASGTILAATDLTDSQYPIVRQAGRLGTLGHVPVVALHNVLPARIEIESRAPWPAARRPDPFVMTHQLQTLVTATREHQVSTAILTALIDPVEAILREARASRPDLVVVGTRPRRAGASGRRSVSAQLVNLLRQSVLLMPCNPKTAENVLPAGERAGA